MGKRVMRWGDFEVEWPEDAPTTPEPGWAPEDDAITREIAAEWERETAQRRAKNRAHRTPKPTKRAPRPVARRKR